MAHVQIWFGGGKSPPKSKSGYFFGLVFWPGHFLEKKKAKNGDMSGRCNAQIASYLRMKAKGVALFVV